MIALLLASRAFAQESPEEMPPVAPIPAEPPPAEPEPVPVPAEPVPAAPEPGPLVDDAPDDDPGVRETTPWVTERPDERRELLRYALSAELGSLGNDDPAYDLFSEGDTMGSVGVGLGFGLSKNLDVIGSWHHFRHGADVSVGSTDTDADFQSQARTFQSAWMAHEGTLGVRLQAPIRDVLVPYVAARGVLFGARMRLDDDPEVNDNPGQIQAGAITGGAMTTAGVQLRIPPGAGVQAMWNLELGHSFLGRAEFGEFGSMKLGGFVARSGLGLRF